MDKFKEQFKRNKKEYIIILLLILIIIIKLSSNVLLNKKIEVKEAPLLASNKKIIKKIKVDVKGSVNNPGVYELEENSRVIDAINLAGGLTENANTSNINLSLKLKDEMIIIVYSNEQMNEYKNKNTKTEYVYVEIEKCPDLMNDACINKTSMTSQTDETSSIISINTATLEQLKSLPGIGDSKASDIIKYREKEGNFQTIEDIKNVSGIGDSLFEKIKDYITI